MVAITDTASVRLKIGGMTCASCVGSVTDALESVPGVVRADVSLVMEAANVSYRTGRLSVAGLADAVHRAGYDATVERAAQDDVAEPRRSESTGAGGLLMRAVASIAVAAATMIGMWSIEWLDLPGGFEITLNVVAFILVTPIMIWAGGVFYRSAWAALLRGTSNMDSLIALGITAAYGYSFGLTVAQVATREMHVWGDSANASNATYFEVAAAIIGLVMLGRWMESNTRRKSSEAVKRLVEMQPQTAVIELNGEQVATAVSEITEGSIVLVRPGERIAVDGTVERGSCDIDESMLTGESVPVTKSRGEQVFAGTVCLSGSVRVRAVSTGSGTLLAEITRNVALALSSRAPIERLVDKVTKYFVPAILLVAVVTFALWMLLGPSPNLPSAIIAATTVLVIACPCALGLATPTAVVAGIGRASRFGALIKNAEALERLSSVDTAILDKTGTLTYGQMRVSAVHVVESSGVDRDRAISLAASVECNSEHPIGRAITDLANHEQVAYAACDEFSNEPGVGVAGEVDGQRIEVSRPGAVRFDGSWAMDSVKNGLDEARRMSQSAVVVSVDASPVAVIALEDRLRENAADSVAALKSLGVETHMLTGDNAEVAKAVAKKTGVDAVWAGVSPTGKSATVRRLRERGQSVAMVGDGVNDGPALAEAEVGIAMGAGTDVAIEAADVALINNDLAVLPSVVRLARGTIRVIRQNLAWAFGYNLLLVPIAAGALVPLFADSSAPTLLRPLMSADGVLNPIAAAGAMALSSISVSLNSLRLRRFRA